MSGVMKDVYAARRGTWWIIHRVQAGHTVSRRVTIKKLNDDATINTQFRVLIKTVK